MVRFNARANPTPSRTTHNTLIEVAWTVMPVVILLVIAIPSFRLLFSASSISPPADVTVKATGKQWYWSYDLSGRRQLRVRFADAAGRREQIQPEPPRLLGVDNDLVVPVNKVVRVLTTGADVIHAFAVPSFGIKIDVDPRPHQRDLVQGRPARASITASARNCAARITPSCRSRSGW